MAEKIGKASLRDASIGTGIAVDKMLARTGQTPVVHKKDGDPNGRDELTVEDQSLKLH